ncbi:hypothetical protein GCM10023188_43070 [Pontibacter saemangeumensis]|uniref:MEDS domain-containing protein n=1 Tax=Pontibacter saemangeumensis TaxID=1084525 RepID=A0ABP8M322_9BACT
MDKAQDWQHCNSETFWREIAACSHVLQIYENDQALLNLLEDFVVGGISVGDCVILIATEWHLAALEKRLRDQGLDTKTLYVACQYIPLNAKEMLEKFMVNGWPDEGLFVEAISSVFNRIRDNKQQVRAFGEMVSLLWGQGNGAATIRLEHLWNAFFEKETFSLLCAYPQDKFPDHATSALSCICKAHSRIITNSGEARFDLAYQDVY